MKLNSRTFSSQYQLQSFTRKDAYECCIPKTKSQREEAQVITASTNPPTLINPLITKSIPSENLLIRWRSELDYQKRGMKGFNFIQSSIGDFDAAVIQMLLKLHQAH